ncbi:MAG: DUF1461 domain-containing protein [Clostridia bacterium]|nr:DUF1461 domain-containing protein [Clostridia bacterium]
MKFLDRVFALLLNACILIVTLAVPAFAMMSSKQYYYDQFEKNGIYQQVNEAGNAEYTVIDYVGGETGNRAIFSDEQLNVIIDHIVEYLFSDQESFALVMDNVKLNGEVTDGVSVFGDTAVKHMADVRELLRLCIAITAVAGVALVLFAVYFSVRRRRGQGGILLKYTLIFYGIFLLAVLTVCLWTLIDVLREGFEMSEYTGVLWRNLHHFMFPDPEKFANAFLNDTLTEILTLDLFMTAVYIILAVVFSALLVWLALGAYLDKMVKKSRKMP